MDWSLLACGRSGHVTYAPDEPAVRERLTAATPAGPGWRCLRCGTFVPGDPGLRGPAAAAPAVRRDADVRSAFILKIFAIERFIRALLFGAAGYAVWRFRYSQASIERAFDRDLPVVRALLRQLGYDISHSRLVGLIQHALTLSPGTISLVAAGLTGYAVIELVEGTGLWLGRRWGEYFAMVATSLGLPYEVYDLTSKVTATRAVFFAINLALVLYLVITKRLFGVRGGRRAYEARLRGESIMQAAIEAAATGPAATGPAAAKASAAQAPAAQAARTPADAAATGAPATPADAAATREPATPADAAATGEPATGAVAAPQTPRQERQPG